MAGLGAQAPKEGDVIADKYFIEAELGRGGMGVVYHARHVLTDRAVALKWMMPDPNADAVLVERFLREARALGRIAHANVVGVLDVGVHHDGPFMVMDLLNGYSLRAYVSPEGMSYGQAVSLLLPALDGVHAAHRAGVVHRDLKPENLFVVVEDEMHASTKVLDFGVSKLRDDTRTLGAPSSLTMTGTTVGTPMYMSPEQVYAKPDLDGRADVWSLGAILYELITGRVPFKGDSFGELVVAIATQPFEPLDVAVPDVPRELALIVQRALEKDPEQRFQSAAELAHALAPFAPNAPRSISITPTKAAPTVVSVALGLDQMGVMQPKSTPANSESASKKRSSITPRTPAKHVAAQVLDPTADLPEDLEDHYRASTRGKALYAVGAGAAILVAAALSMLDGGKRETHEAQARARVLAEQQAQRAAGTPQPQSTVGNANAPASKAQAQLPDASVESQTPPRN